MAILLNDTIQNNSPKPVDNKYGIFASGAFRAYNSVSEANATIPSAYRSMGLTVLINTGSANIEYWYKAGITDSDLIPKLTSLSANSPLALGSGILTINQSTTSTDGYLSSTDWNTFNGKVTTAANLGSGSGLFANKTGTTLNFKSISPVANTGLTMTTSGTDIQFSINGVAEYSPATTTTTSPTVINTIPIENNSSGVIEVTMIAVSTTPGSALVGKKYLVYQKISGILTSIGSSEEIIPASMSGFTTASWDIILNSTSNNLDIEVIGENSSIKWLMKSEKFFNS